MEEVGVKPALPSPRELGYLNTVAAGYFSCPRVDNVIFSPWNANCNRGTSPKTCILPPGIPSKRNWASFVAKTWQPWVKRSLYWRSKILDLSVAHCDWVVYAVNREDKPMGHWLLAVPGPWQKNKNKNKIIPPFLDGGIIFPPLSGMLDPCQSSSNN